MADRKENYQVFRVKGWILNNIQIQPSLKAELAFFFSCVSRAQHFAPARTRTQVVRIGAQCTDHWTGQSCGIGVPVVQLTVHVKSNTLYGCMVVWSYGRIQIFSVRWVTTILYNYGVMLCKLRYKVPYYLLLKSKSKKQ